MNWLQFQGLFPLTPNLDGSGGCLAGYSLQIDVPGGDIDGHLDKCRNTQDFNPTARIVRLDFGAFRDLPLVILGVYP